MAEQWVCPQGHSVTKTPSETDAGGASDVPRCPVCGDVLTKEPAGKPKGLWSVMGREQASPDGDTSHERPSAASPTEPSSDESADKPKSLWSVMQQGPKPKSADDAAPGAAARPKRRPAAGSKRPKVATPPWAEPGAAASAAKSASGRSRPAAGPSAASTMSPGTTAVPAPPKVPVEEAEEPDFLPLDDEPSAPPAESAIAVPSAVSTGAVTSLVLGIASVGLSVMALGEAIWTKIPSTLIGFSALVVGLLAAGDIRRSYGRLTGRRMALAGMLLGTVGSLLGPTLFAGLGRSWRQEAGRGQTAEHLESIGQALTDFHSENGRFPAGTLFGADGQGREQPLHGWMTQLLPHLGEADLFSRIDLAKPYNADVNLPAMSTDVEVFFAAGADRRHIGRGFAVTHFAGLGGERLTAEGRLVHIGIFADRNGIRREEIRDGLTTTAIAGEIAYGFPPWGEPGNYRVIGAGINRGIDGFGNAAGTGAMFLFADGSVRFLPNSTSRDVLERLSTRDGSDDGELPKDLFP